MSTGISQYRVLSTVMTFALVAAICGASPQEGRVPRPQPQSQPQAPPPSAAPAPSSSPRPQSPEGRVPRQSPNRRTQDHPRPSGGMRLSGVHYIAGTRLIIPPPWQRCRVLPDLVYWQHRDLIAEIQWLSRGGFIPVTPLGNGVDALSDFVQVPAGWRAYGLAVPAGGTVQVEVQHEKLGWFRLMLVDQWGTPGPGMLQAAIAHQPVLVTYQNPGKEATAVYVIVDDPAWWSDAKFPYTLVVRRDWDPAQVDLSQVKMVAGLWGATPSVTAQFRGRSLTGPAVFPH